MPILPLDGGNVAYSIEQWVTKKHSGVITRVISLLVAVGVGLWALSIEWLWVVFLMALFAWNNGSALFQLLQYDRDGSVRPLLDQAQEAVKNDDGATAVQLAKEALNSARSVEVKEEAQRILLQGLILGGDIEQAKKEADRLQAVYGHAAFAIPDRFRKGSVAARDQPHGILLCDDAVARPQFYARQRADDRRAFSGCGFGDHAPATSQIRGGGV